ncbi:MAG: 4-(cytidine 5'-diphospho)-2-C-methyl-D-erythritol kinase [Lachnospiraceae bacterium]|nr:4-(cytidine 5'-diphospho)-2-C-methyl-D-erythritol kinase [Lachnospiraceae bacterium]
MIKSFNANAKLNLILDVIKKREDGYHDISSVMQSICLHDVITVSAEASEKKEIKVSCSNAGDFSSVKWDESNLVYKAAALMLTESEKMGKSPVKVSIEVEKNIPAGAGMGGGSADAATVLKALNEMLSLGLSEEKLCQMGAKLGADVPFCIIGGTALCEGIGERITPLPFPGPVPCVILKPEVSLGTREMYEITDEFIDSSEHPSTDYMETALLSGRTRDFFSACSNFMEEAAVRMCPEINVLKRLLKEAGAEVSMMTGSGSAVFGLFSSEEKAKKAFEELNPPKAKKFISQFSVD